MPNKSQCKAHISQSRTLLHQQHIPSINNLKMACSMHRPQHVQTSNVLTLLIVAGLCANLAASTPTLRQNMSSTSSSGIRARQCREGCIEKYATDETFCQRNPECLTCYDECAKPPPPKINKSIRETWSLHTVSMLQQDSLVLVDVAWLPLSQPNQCLVTWEVAGGGLMGNLLTESFNVQLSLWPDTKYRVQVTCKNKLNGVMSRSLPLTIDTAEAITPQDQTVQQHNKQQIAETVLKVTKEPIVTTNLNDIANSIDDEKSVEQDSISNYHTNNKNSNNNNRQPAPISPYDDDESSVETLNQLHTKFIFNWHPSDIHKKPDPDHIVTFAVKSDDMQTSLLIGLLLVTLLILVFTLSWYQHRRTKDAPNDKTALFGKDVHAIIVSVPPPVGADGTKDATTSQTACVADEVCKHSTMCSRNALKV